MDLNDDHITQSEAPKETRNQDTRGLLSQLLTGRNFLLALATIITLSISYYFVIALPSHNEAILKLERDKFQATLDEKKKEEQEKKLKADQANEDAQYRQGMLYSCLSAADNAYWDYIKLNGTPVKGKKGVYNTTTNVQEMALKAKKEAIDECHRKWETK